MAWCLDFLFSSIFSFLICLYTFSWEFHPTKATSSQSPAPSLPAKSPSSYSSAPKTASQKYPYSVSYTFYFTVFANTVVFSRNFFHTVSKFLFLPPLWSLPWPPLLWNHSFSPKLSNTRLEILAKVLFFYVLYYDY